MKRIEEQDATCKLACQWKEFFNSFHGIGLETQEKEHQE
jgi:hypothetical protein